MPWRRLFGLLLAFGLLALVYSLTTPLFEAPDEPWHYAYVRWLAEGHGLPRLDDDASGANQEVAQPPLYYAVAALMSGFVADDDLPELFWHNPQFGYQAGGTVNDNKNMLIHTDRERFPGRDAALAVRLTRLASLFFGLLTVAATYGLAREALSEQPLLAAVAVGVVAFTPQFLFISGVVSNDSAAAAAGALALWALARIIHLGPTPRRASAAGLTLGLALLSKTSTLLLVPIALLALAMGWQRTSATPDTQAGGNRVRWFPWREAGLMVGLAVLVGGWWYLRNWLMFDDPLGLGIHVNTPWGRSEPAGLLDVLTELPQVFRSFWGAFGWGHVELFGLLYVALGVLVGLAVLGWLRLLLQMRTWVWEERPADDTADSARSSRRRVISATAGVVLLCALWYLGVLIALLRWMQQVEAPHGRLLFPALGALGVLLAVGWSGLFPSHFRFTQSVCYGASPVGQEQVSRRRIVRLLLLVPVAGLFLLSLLAPFVFIRPAFARPRLLSPEQATQRVTPQVLVYDDKVRLLGYRVEPKSVTPGGRVRVTLCWEALRAIDQDYTLFIHLLGRDSLRVGERTTYPGQGRFPTTLWPVGQAFCDSYWLSVADWAPSPELYALEVGLYDADTGWRLPVKGTTGQPVEPPVVGVLSVTPEAPSVSPEHSLSYELGGQIALIGYDSSADVAGSSSGSLSSSDTVTLTLYWEALQAPQGDFKVFVHLVDRTGTLVTQDDAPPRGGGYPTWAWQPGDIVPDSHQVKLPDERPAGPYYWLVGMYRPETRVRLPVSGPEGIVPNDAIPLGEVRD
jgi:hypothetical protein